MALKTNMETCRESLEERFLFLLFKMRMSQIQGELVRAYALVALKKETGMPCRVLKQRLSLN